MREQVLLISGADGFLGRSLSSAFSAEGWHVYGLIHNLREKKVPTQLAGAFDYSFPDCIDPAALKLRPQLFIHSAFHTRMNAHTASHENVEAARFLLNGFGRRDGCRFVFVSSMSAHENAFSRYGAEKLAIEKLLDPARDLAVRPGFIIGYGGVFQRLALMLSKMPFVPLFYGANRPIHSVHVDDVSRSVLGLVAKGRSGIWPVGEERPVTISTFYHTIADWLGKHRFLVPLPGTPFLQLMRFFERCGIDLPLTSENLLGLKGLIGYDVSATIQELGFRPMPLRLTLSKLEPRVFLDSKCRLS
jgi:NADH dehydrogenase